MLKVTVQDNLKRGGERLIAARVICADTPSLRRRGLLGRQTLDADEGLLLVIPPRLGLSLFHAIHMFGVPFELAAAWLGEEGVILDVKCASPGGMYFPSGFFTRSRYILEVHPAHLPLLQEGNIVCWREAAYG